VTEPVQKRRRICRNSNESVGFNITFDGGSRGNPGISGAGTQIISTITTTTTTIGPNQPHQITTTNHRRKTDIRHYLGNYFTNNQAEYQGLICGLEYVLQDLSTDYKVSSECPEVTMVVQGDSNLIIEQLNGNYDCKSPKLRPLYQKAKKLVRDITNHTSQRLKVTFEHVYRNNNKIADGTLIQNTPHAAVFDCVLTIPFLCILSYPILQHWPTLPWMAREAGLLPMTMTMTTKRVSHLHQCRDSGCSFQGKDDYWLWFSVLISLKHLSPSKFVA
jgi:ribonuclease HI